MITCLHHRAPCSEQQRILLLMLPGVGIEVGDFSSHGLVAAVHDRGLPVDIVAARPELDLYFDGTIAAEIDHLIVKPAQQAGYARIWCLGISLGGMGALLYASSKYSNIDGIILLSPFVGTKGTISEISNAGSLAQWSSGTSNATRLERELLLWLKEFLSERPATPALYLGYGLSDRFAIGHTMLAEQLPKDRVVTTDGGHNWMTWAKLWRQILDDEPFAEPPSLRA